MSQVAPNTAVKRYTMPTAALPNCLLPVSVPRRENPPARNIAIPVASCQRRGCARMNGKMDHTLTNRTPVQRPSTSDSVQGEHAYECGEHVRDIIESRNPLRVAIGDTRNPEYRRRVHRNSSNPDPFLDNLQPNHQLHPPAQMQF